MLSNRTYTLSELESESGFDKRTIAYYVQEDLLPRIGRRGRSTRYPQEFLDRLLFIRRVRDLQDEGGLRAVTLGEIRSVVAALSPGEVRALARKNVSADRLRALFEHPDEETTAHAVPAEEAAADEVLAMALSESSSSQRGDRSGIARFFGAKRGAKGFRRARSLPEGAARTFPALDSAALSDDQSGAGEGDRRARIAELLAEIERRAGQGAAQYSRSGRENLTKVALSPNVFLSARHLRDEESELVEELARLIREWAEEA
jgi:DNA-binding transcriptional MerR regulator